MYVFSEEDCTSAFRGKVGPLLKNLEKNSRLHNAFRQLGEEWNLKFHVLKQLEEFPDLPDVRTEPRVFDGRSNAKLLRKMLGEDEKLTSKSKVNLARLPPCYCA